MSQEARIGLEQRLSVVMVILSFIFLVLMGGLLHHYEQPELEGLHVSVMLYGLLFLWPLFIIEFLIHFLIRDPGKHFWKHNWYDLFACVVPPLRVGARRHVLENQIWLPFLGWQRVDRHLRKRLERFFSVPMIVIALMILPFLTIEYGGWEWAQAIRQHPSVQLFLYIGTSVIWIAFALEFIIMVSVADKKLLYCAQNWLNLVIILLPLLAFLRSLRLLQLGRIARVYRLRGLTLRAWRAVLLLNLIQRMMGQSLESRLKALQELLAAKEAEVEDLRKEIEVLQTRIAGREAKQES